MASRFSIIPSGNVSSYPLAYFTVSHQGQDIGHNNIHCEMFVSPSQSFHFIPIMLFFPYSIHPRCSSAIQTLGTFLCEGG